MVTRGLAARENDEQRSSGDDKKNRYLSEQTKADSESPVGVTVLRKSEDEEENSILNETRNEEGGQTLINKSNSTGKDTEDKQLSQVEETGEKIGDNPIVRCREKLFMRKDNYLHFITSEGEP